MHTTVVLDKTVETLLQRSQQQTTVAAEVVAPAPEPIPEPVVTEPAPEEKTNADKKPVPNTYFKMAGKIGVGIIGFTQEFAFEKLADKKLRKKARKIAGFDAMDILNRLLKERRANTRNGNNEPVVLNEEEEQLLLLYDKVNAFTDDLELEEESKENIAWALEELLKEQGAEPTPIQLLLLSIGDAMYRNTVKLSAL